MNNLLFLQNLGTGEILIIALVVLLLFGGKKIPELMRGLGKGVRSFKDGMNDVEKTLKEDIMADEPGRETSKKVEAPAETPDKAETKKEEEQK